MSSGQSQKRRFWDGPTGSTLDNFYLRLSRRSRFFWQFTQRSCRQLVPRGHGESEVIERLIEFIPFQKQDGEIVVGVGITGLNTAPVHLFSQSGIAKLICIEISERKEALGLSQPRPLFKNRLCL